MPLCRSSFLAFVSAIAASTAACGGTEAPSGADAATGDAALSDAATADGSSGQDAQQATDTGTTEPKDAGGDACPMGTVQGLDGGCVVLE